MQTLSLETYTIFVGKVLPQVQQFLHQGSWSQIVLIMDQNTEEYCLPVLKQSVNTQHFLSITVPAGELHKNINTCQFIWKKMMDANVGRRALCVNLGGGVIGDMGGFAASTYKRGIDFVQIPTTLLSQVDASIGGKLGIDFNDVKNSVGVFRNPKAVFIDPVFYQTLPKREIRSGFAEIIKHSLIRSAEQWREIQKIDNLSAVEWEQLLLPSLSIKKEIVEIDPFEAGLRKALNFGHTIGHAIESYFLETDTPLLHGEAIAIGMICEAWLSQKIVGLPRVELEAITTFLLHQYGTVSWPEAAFPFLIKLMKKDKKNEANEINFTLIESAGKVVINQSATERLIRESMGYYQAMAKNHNLKIS